jgi:2',3'-cyclic-nucleotide 2'-phosphodiesterase / 3'-nucleotidase
MRRRHLLTVVLGSLLLSSLAAGLAVGLAAGPAPKARAKPAAGPERVALTILATSDLHGYMMPFDYYANRPANRGLAKVATIVRKIRKQHPDALLIDCGDTIQGSPMEDLHSHQVQAYLAAHKDDKRPASPDRSAPRAADDPGPDPMIAAMNALDYDAMVVGNHEFNFGLDTMLRAKKEAEFPWISANVTAAANAQEAMAIHNKDYNSAYNMLEERVMVPLIVNVINGVTVAVIGLTTPAVSSFEQPDNISAYRFEGAVASAREWVKYARERRQADVVIVAAHLGLERGIDDPTPFPSQLPGENAVYEIAQKVPGIDAIVFGHTHQEMAGKSVNGVILAQPKFWGQSVAQVTITLERAESAGPDNPNPWKVVAKASEVIPVTSLVTSDREVEDIAKPYHEAAQKYLDTPVAQSKAPLETRLSRVMDTSALEAIQQVQLAAAKADVSVDVSLSAVFDTHVQIPAGPVTVRQLAALYPYENTLVIVAGNGQMLKDALEHSARYFLTYNTGASPPSLPQSLPQSLPPSLPQSLPPSLIDPQVFGYNYDAAAGAGGNLSYKIDLTKPPGQRIVDLQWKGAPLDMKQELRLAINSYRKAGGGGYEMFHDAKIAWQSPVDIRQLMIEYYTDRKTMDTPAAEAWSIVPEEARKILMSKPE